MVKRAWVGAMLLSGVLFSACDEGVEETTGKVTQEAASAANRVVEVKSPVNGANVKGNVVRLDLEAPAGIAIKKADGDKSGNTGHYHVFVDKEPVAAGAVIPQEVGIIHSTDDPVLVTGVSKGRHTLAIVLGNGAHERIGDRVARLTVDVEGPTVDATVPTTPAANQAFSIDVKSDGVELVAANGDRSGRTGHLHVFANKDPTPAGQAIPTGDPMIIHSAKAPITVPGLPSGQHTLWVVLGDGAHYPFDPPVMEKLQVTIP